LDAELAAAAAVIIPYTLYWQSGIAVRAVELGTNVVGLPTEFLRLLLGADYPGFPLDASVAAWERAVVSTIDAPSDLDARRIAYIAKVDESWERLLADPR
jgi:hypothetical protein